ncbi:transglycosylase SLT domain-containing protein [Blastococcus sp. PRF04-17]|uniref:aggregation-promoting factor C-terminal-like domain-containing protein n=1 Tax=Blastococcus sp. PRF04-17 TaxID=2933797 RepID=UPI001FF69318|nr:transglycosylase SLT domain-containing protein [Blastococcus sp. PRF04-17]UOY02210.1 transglycosylase SLT domain-containing protein [Blastococcus sp. PRF04-17]
MNLRSRTSLHALRRSASRPPLSGRRPALYLGVAASGALMVSVLTAGAPAEADPQLKSVSIAEQLGIPAGSPAPLAAEEAVRPLEQLAASRSEREDARTAAAQAQAAADRAERDRIAAEEAARKAAAEKAAAEAAAAEAARRAEAEAAAAGPGRGTSAPVAPSGSYQDYAMQKLGGSGSEFSCLENLWGKESGWNPNAQNPTSTAYGIPQFLDSTWAGTGIAKTSDGYRQIDAGLIYIEQRYGSPCAAWGHSQAHNWY